MVYTGERVCVVYTCVREIHQRAKVIRRRRRRISSYSYSMIVL